MRLVISAAAIVVIGALNTYSLAVAGSRIGAALAAFFAVFGLLEARRLRREHSPGAWQVLIWALAAQVPFALFSLSVEHTAECQAELERARAGELSGS